MKLFLLGLTIFFSTQVILSQEVYKSHKVRIREYNPQFEEWSNWSSWEYTILGKSKMKIEVFKKGFNIFLGSRASANSNNLYVKNIEYIRIEKQFYGDVYTENNNEIGSSYFDFSDNLDYSDVINHNFDKDFILTFYLYRNDGGQIGLQIYLDGDK
ncbi:hypothetical protein [Aquimarina algiphila]|uniref:hypothetical protein n=1 Tax=Aquimarina algiphila TaxID=2047982 RepID=UPI002493999A|nr:hypothetical protein [Aquimarina algiphila]